MRVLVGSAALRQALPNRSLPRSPRDRDYLVTKEEVRGEGEDLIRADLLLSSYSFASPVADLDELFTLKVSHSPWVVTDLRAWYKHLADIRFMREQGARVNEDLHAAAYAQWEDLFGAKRVRLTDEAQDFFTEGVKRYYDHDSVHAAVALGGDEAFRKILMDGSEVRVSREKFLALTDPERCRLVFEETMVLSLERDLIPAHRRTGADPCREDIDRSYAKQLRLLITQYSKGWFPRWIIENYFLVGRPPLNYWALFQESPKKIPLG